MKLITVNGNESGSYNSMINDLNEYKININHIVSMREFIYTVDHEQYFGTEINLINTKLYVEESMNDLLKLILNH